MSRQIRTSVKAVIIQHDKLLAIRLNDGKEEWYILPGGGQDCEEMLPQTVEREVREEAGIPTAHPHPPLFAGQREGLLAPR